SPARTARWTSEAVAVAAPWRPTREQVAAAEGRTIPDVLEPGLDVVFCGVNPSLYSGAVGHHFARPGNRLLESPAPGRVHRPRALAVRGRPAPAVRGRRDEPGR